MKNHIAKFISLVLVFGLLLGCAPVLQATVVPTLEPVHIKVGMQPYLSNAPFFIAQEEGFFAAQNLEVEFVDFQLPQDATAAMVGGQIDVMNGLISVGLINAMNQDVHLKIVSDKGYFNADGCTSTALLAHKDVVTNGELNLSSENLNQLKISSGKTTIHEYFLDTYLGPLGLPSENITEIAMPIYELPGAIKSKNMDLVFISEPWVTRILGGQDAVIYKNPKMDFPNAQYAVVIFGPTLLEENTSAGNRFLTAYLQAVKQYLEGPTDRNVEIINKYTNIEPAELKSLCWTPIRADGIINTQTIVDFQNWALSKGYLTKVLSVDEFWDPSFAEFAQSQIK